MLYFNTLLNGAGIDPARVKLVRHQDARAKRGGGPHDLWLAGRIQDFETYQSIQSKPRYTGAEYIASFVGTPMNDTLFVGLYAVNGVGQCPPGMTDVIVGGDHGGKVLYQLQKSDLLADYAGRVVVDWGKGFLAWVQSAEGKDKPIVEIRRKIEDPPFPGLLQFQTTIGALDIVPASWRPILMAVKGVYLLVCLKTGKQYVGSAYGAGGFWERWYCYYQNGHGGNEGMKLDPHTEYQVSILEVAGSAASIPEVIAAETRWKGKLRSLGEFGLNQN